MPLRHSSLAEDIYLTIRHEIQNLIIPPREQLDEGTLARRFGISRTPVREAIRRLVADDLIDLFPHQSARVRPILFERVRDYFECLRVMQKAVFVLSAARITAPQIAIAEAAHLELEVASERRDTLSIPDLNTAFHATIAEGAGNHHLFEGYERLLMLGTRMAALTVRHYVVSQWDDEMAKLSVDHRDILEAAREHDQHLMADLSDRHVELFRTQTVDAMASEKSDGLVNDISDTATRHLLPSDPSTGKRKGKAHAH
ncbi:MAG: GntR family transcriptional regulator [Rhodospirillales bacterium]|nr:GntR family transcriptional regulator [Rhodospirillales bacterium]